MTIQKKIKLENNTKSKHSFRTIHYLGSKLRVLNFIEDVINDLDPDKNAICDLFAGTGSVSQHLSYDRRIISVDIQNYSSVICSALLNPISDNFINAFHQKIVVSKNLNNYLEIFSPLIKFEENIITNKSTVDLELICNFLENSSLYSASIEIPNNASEQLKESFTTTIRNLRQYNQNDFLATKYFGGVYFSYKQAVCLDVILFEINKASMKYKNILLAALLSTASDIVNTVGKQFAQPIRPRDKNGLPKKGIIKQLKKDRDLDVFSIYNKWLLKYSKRKIVTQNHEVLQMDYKKALKNLPNDVKIIYADPPYTRDHYSRFYHVLETLCLMDFPKISTSKINGEEKLSRGLYRENRVQSDFCIKTKAPDAFEELFKLASEKNKTLILSYSPYDKSKGSHPRVVEIEFLQQVAKKYYKSVNIKSIGKFLHSKLNKTELHLKAEEESEVLIICQDAICNLN